MSKRYPEVITPVNMTTANTEYSYTFPAHAKSFMLQTRDGAAFKYAYKTGQIVLGNYITAHQGVSKVEDYAGSEQPITVYFMADEDGIVMEGEYFL
jgi:hypothetical protein